MPQYKMRIVAETEIVVTAKDENEAWRRASLYEEGNVPLDGITWDLIEAESIEEIPAETQPDEEADR